ncbi:increased DNA methylation 2-like [Lotus japonicus]|uniref:increased DNA methylation 2-like n=1 Tax=Lotus japonicus TaxID=34305 RepID=UPI0025898D6B|nr:increased DNA methylation 2-like [Lotus japonicus]
MDQGNNNNLETQIPNNDDQCFLLFFIMGTYFGPDIKGQTTKKSVLQRVAEGLPSYTLDQLTNSVMKVVELEHIYYYILRNADKKLTLNLPFLRRTFEGVDRAENCNYPQFSDMFPPDLHPICRFKNRHKVVNSIVFVNNPEVLCHKLEDVERFKRLSGVSDFHVDSEAARLHLPTCFDGGVLRNMPEVNENEPLPTSCTGTGSQKPKSDDFSELQDHSHRQHAHAAAPEDVERLHTCFDGSVLCNMPVEKAEPNENEPLPAFQSCTSTGSQKPKSDDFAELQDHSLRPHAHGAAPIKSVPCDDANVMCGYTVPGDENDPDKVGPAMLFLPSRPTENEWSDIVAATKNGFGLTGSAAMGRAGPIIGLVDIGECEDSYLFRMSLPGVKRDEREFSCEVDTDGKVLISGATTTGEKTVSRYSQVFDMQTQNLCPPGPFSITFQLPGPVDPHQFSGNFGTDGILEGIVMKRKPT